MTQTKKATAKATKTPPKTDAQVKAPVDLPKPKLTTTDLHVMQRALDMGMRAGAFGAGDAFTVGMLMQKLVAIAPPPPEPEAQPQKAE